MAFLLYITETGKDNFGARKEVHPLQYMFKFKHI
jgi:hypothetical protein